MDLMLVLHNVTTISTSTLLLYYGIRLTFQALSFTLSLE
jgi:hypothetical protein